MSPNAPRTKLQGLYDLETELKVEQFLITDAALGANPDKTPELRRCYRLPPGAKAGHIDRRILPRVKA